MKTAKSSSSPLNSLRTRKTTRHRFLIALFAVLACFSALLFDLSIDVLSQSSKQERARRAATARAKKVHAKASAKRNRDNADKANEPVAGEADDPDARLNWFMFQRMYPFNEIPAGARRLAWDAVPRRDKQANIEAVGTIWSSIGPTPTTSAFPNNGGFTSGRINAIAISPTNAQIVLIGSASGGIWRSTDGGTTFTPVTDNQVDLAVGTIAFAPSNSSIVYAGMGDQDNGYFGTGVLKSTDAGMTWTKISNSTLPLWERGRSIPGTCGYAWRSSDQICTCVSKTGVRPLAIHRAPFRRDHTSRSPAERNSGRQALWRTTLGSTAPDRDCPSRATSSLHG